MLAIRLEGGLFDPDILESALAGDLPGQQPRDFGLDGSRSLTDEIAGIFADAQAQWAIFRRRLARTPLNPPAGGGDWGGATTAITRDAWVIPFLSLLGYDLHANPHPYAIDEARFAISHRAGACPVMSPFRFRCVFCATQPRAQQPPARKIHPRARSCLVEHPLQVRLDAARRQPQRRRDRCIRMSSRD